MSDLSEKIKEIENQIENALSSFELHDQLDKALKAYQDAEADLVALGIGTENPAFSEQQRVLSYCLMRQGNILRQMEEPGEALAIGKRELATARASGDDIALARSLMSNGTNDIVTGEISHGLSLIEEARMLFERGNSFEHKQGLGWYWILQADLANAGLVEKEPSEVIEITTLALELLKSIENWSGVARAYSARAKAHEKLGDEEQAAKDRQQQKTYEGKSEKQEGTGERQ
jgi:tetratricopeptide (TPR) repeat protein